MTQVPPGRTHEGRHTRTRAPRRSRGEKEGTIPDKKAEKKSKKAQAAYEHPFDKEQFAEDFSEIARLISEEWPQVDADALIEIEPDPDAVVDLVVEQTGHSRTRVRKSLAEIAEVADVSASGIEGRLTRLVHQLEQRVEPVQDRVRHTRERATEVARDVDQRRREMTTQAEETVRENVWTSLLAALGVGLLIGLVVGLTRGK